jgi:hypothetical protein
VTSEPRAYLAFDLGGASTSVALIGRVRARWRLIGSLSMPSGADPDAVAATLVERTVRAEPELASIIGVSASGGSELTRLTVVSHRPRRLAVVGASERSVAALTDTAARAGWVTASASVEGIDPLEMSGLLLEPDISAFLVGTGDPPTAEERRNLAELAAAVAAAAARRPDLTIILAGAMSEHATAFGDPSARVGEVLLAPAPGRVATSGPLADLLLELAIPPDDARRSLAAAGVALAEVLDRRVELVDIGYDAGTRIAAWPAAGNGTAGSDIAVVPGAALAPRDPDDAVVERVGTWSTWGADRHRLRDRMRELRIAPWADSAGDGVDLRMAAARAALGRLTDATPGWSEGPPPDLVVATGGAWAVAPGPVVELVLVDVMRRPGAAQYALDHARALAPLGAIPDIDERRTMLADLADDLLAPLGTVVIPAGMRSGRSAGALVVHGNGSDDRIDLLPGGLTVVDLPPGASAVAEFSFRDTVRLGGRGRHFAIDVSGGLGGLLLDLRDVPMKLPDRADLRGELLESWRVAVAGVGD